MNKLAVKLRVSLLLLSSMFLFACGSDDNPSPPSLDTVKQFISELRTWGNAASLDVNTQTSEFNLQLDNAGLMYDITGPLLDSAMGHAVDAGISAYNSGADINDLQTFFDVDPLNTVIATGSATVNPAAGTVVVAGTIDGVSVSLIFSFPSLIATTFDATIVGKAENADASLGIDGTLTVNYGEQTDLTPWLIDHSLAPFPNFERIAMDAEVTITEIGTAVSPVRFVGALNAEILAAKDASGVMVIDPVTNEPYYNPKLLSMSGEFSTSSDGFQTLTHSYTASMTAGMRNASTFVPVPQSYFAGQTYAVGTYTFSNDGNSLTMDIPNTYKKQISFNPATGIVTVTETYGTMEPYSYDSSGWTSLAGYLSWYSGFAFSVWIDGQGLYDVDYPDATTGSGVLTGLLWSEDYSDENATNFRELVDLTLSFEAHLSGLPPATITFTGSRTGFQNANFNMTIAYDNHSIVFSSAALLSFGNIRVAISDGELTVNLVFNEDGTLSIVSGATVYGTIDTDPVTGITKITYTDGTFEIL